MNDRKDNSNCKHQHRIGNSFSNIIIKILSWPFPRLILAVIEGIERGGGFRVRLFRNCFLGMTKVGVVSARSLPRFRRRCRRQSSWCNPRSRNLLCLTVLGFPFAGSVTDAVTLVMPASCLLSILNIGW